MALQVLQRPGWDGEPKGIGELFILRKDGREAVCGLWTHWAGWECRLAVGNPDEIVQTQVCRTQDEVFSAGERWKSALQLKC
jgi:hypothetical protein